MTVEERAGVEVGFRGDRKGRRGVDVGLTVEAVGLQRGDRSLNLPTLQNLNGGFLQKPPMPPLDVACGGTVKGVEGLMWG